MAWRHCPNLALPEAAYLPGSGSVRPQLNIAGARKPLRKADHRDHRGLAFGIDLFNHRFFWEAHEVWEQTWAASTGKERELLQGLIQIAASRLNAERGKTDGAKRLAERAQKHLRAARSESPFFCGIDLDSFGRRDDDGQIHWMRRTRDLPGSRSDLLVQPFDCDLSICELGIVQATKTRTDYFSGNAIYSDQPVELDNDSVAIWQSRCQQQLKSIGKFHTVQWELEGEHCPSPNTEGGYRDAVGGEASESESEASESESEASESESEDESEGEEKPTLGFLHVLRAEGLGSPPIPANVEIRKLSSDADWNAAAQLSIEVNFADFGESVKPFTRWRYAAFRQTTKHCGGGFFAAFLDGQLVASLGVVNFDRGFRFQDVQTHESFRRRGIARALVAHAFEQTASANPAPSGPGIIVADPQDVAIRLYRSLGFAVVSTIFKLQFKNPTIGA